MDDNVSPEALLTGHRKLRGPVQVVPFEAEGGSNAPAIGIGIDWVTGFFAGTNERVSLGIEN